MPIMRMNSKLIYPELSYKVYGLCFHVHNKLGRYRNEKQYADALEELLNKNKIIIELKAKPVILKEDYFQMMRYLVSFKKKLGLIFNFRQQYLRPKRILNSKV